MTPGAGQIQVEGSHVQGCVAGDEPGAQGQRTPRRRGSSNSTRNGTRGTWSVWNILAYVRELVTMTVRWWPSAGSVHA